MPTLPMNLAGHNTQHAIPSNARMHKQLGVALFRDQIFNTVLKYALVWMLLLAVAAGFAETYASHDKSYAYNLNTPRKLL